MRWDHQNLFVIAGFVSKYFTVILPGSHVVRYNGVFVIAGCHCNIVSHLSNLQSGVPYFLSRREGTPDTIT